MVFIKKGITLVLPGPLIKTRRVGVFNWSKMDLHVVHNWRNVTTYPISITVLPNGQGRKTSPHWGKSWGLVNIPLISEGGYCWNKSKLLFTTTSASPSVLHYLHHVWALSFHRQVMLWPLVPYCGGMSLVLTVFKAWAEWSLAVGEQGTHCVTVRPVLARSLGRGACF